MDYLNTQRIVCPQLRDPSTAAAAARWALRLPGVLTARVQSECAELVLTYDLRATTLGAIRRHLERGGVSCDASLIQRCHLLAVDQTERARRAVLGVTDTGTRVDVPLIRAHAA